MAIPISYFQALVYADIFDYPLTFEEMGKWQIKKTTKDCQKISAEKIDQLVVKKNNYFCLKDRKKNILLRKKREIISSKKNKIAQKVADFCRFIPTVKMIALTGNLAVNNSQVNDDIDFLIICQSGYLWTTRLLMTLLVELTGKRRRPKTKKIKNKICLNMFFDENHLALPKKLQNLFTAHEAAQIKVLIDKDDYYLKFLKANFWLKDYLPLALKDTKLNSFKNRSLKSKINKEIPILLFQLIEKILKNLQLFYLSKKRTKEIITRNLIKFHPQDKSNIIINKYNSAINKLFT